MKQNRLLLIVFFPPKLPLVDDAVPKARQYLYQETTDTNECHELSCLLGKMLCGFLNWIHLDVTANTTEGSLLLMETDGHKLHTFSALLFLLILLHHRH